MDTVYVTSALRKSVGGEIKFLLKSSMRQGTLRSLENTFTLPKAIKLAAVSIPMPCAQMKDSMNPIL